MASARAVAWVDRLSWACIYVGMFAIVLGIVSGGVHLVAGWSLGVIGGLLTAAGIVLVVVRSRLPEPPPPGAQSSSPPQGKT